MDETIKGLLEIAQESHHPEDVLLLTEISLTYLQSVKLEMKPYKFILKYIPKVFFDSNFTSIFFDKYECSSKTLKKLIKKLCYDQDRLFKFIEALPFPLNLEDDRTRNILYEQIKTFSILDISKTFYSVYNSTESVTEFMKNIELFLEMFPAWEESKIKTFLTRVFENYQFISDLVGDIKKLKEAYPDYTELIDKADLTLDSDVDSDGNLIGFIAPEDNGEVIATKKNSRRVVEISDDDEGVEFEEGLETSGGEEGIEYDQDINDVLLDSFVFDEHKSPNNEVSNSSEDTDVDDVVINKRRKHNIDVDGEEIDIDDDEEGEELDSDEEGEELDSDEEGEELDDDEDKDSTIDIDDSDNNNDSSEENIDESSEDPDDKDDCDNLGEKVVDKGVSNKDYKANHKNMNEKSNKTKKGSKSDDVDVNIDDVSDDLRPAKRKHQHKDDKGHKKKHKDGNQDHEGNKSNNDFEL